MTSTLAAHTQKMFPNTTSKIMLPPYLPPLLIIISVPYLANVLHSVSSWRYIVVPRTTFWIGGTGRSYVARLFGRLFVGEIISPSLTSESVVREHVLEVRMLLLAETEPPRLFSSVGEDCSSFCLKQIMKTKCKGTLKADYNHWNESYNNLSNISQGTDRGGLRFFLL